jgi:hypothetical protein
MSDNIIMYWILASSGVKSMNGANDGIHQRVAVDILNAGIGLVRKESEWYE